MPSKKFWSNKRKNAKASKKNKRKPSNRKPNDQVPARLDTRNLTFHQAFQSPSSGLTSSRNETKLGQAPTETDSQHGDPWHDPFHSYLYPPTSLNFQPPFDAEGSHLVRRSPDLTEYAGQGVEVSASMMASGHDQQQQRSQQPPPHRPLQQQTSSAQRPNTHANGASVNGEQVQRHQNVREHDTERQSQPRRGDSVSAVNGLMQSHIQVAKPYVFQQAIEGCLKDVGVAQAREDNIRLAGVQWIENTRQALKLPVRTFDTAVVYYHKFRLVHSDGEYSFVDAAAAALFAACKIEDTLKKSRDILCAAHNLKVPRNEQLSPDDTIFEHHSRSIIGLERLMLEASSFDFRNRHPQTLMIKLAKHYNIGSPTTTPLIRTAYSISLDLYRTFAPLKQTTATLAFACLELAARLHNETSSQHEGIQSIVQGDGYSRWGIARTEVMETMLDLLEVYTHYRGLTVVGPEHPLDTFLNVRIPLNEELGESNLSRFTEYINMGRSNIDPAGYAATVNGVSAAASSGTNGMSGTTGTNAGGIKSPTSPGGAAASGKANGLRQKAGERGREGTVRFILNPDRERQERLVVAEYSPSGIITAQQSSSQPLHPTQAHTQPQAHDLPPRGPSHGHSNNQGHNHRPPTGPGLRPGSSDRIDRSGPGPASGPGLVDDGDRERDRDRTRDRDRGDRDRDRERERERETHGHGQSYNYSHRDRDRDRDRDDRPLRRPRHD